ncbi:MAG: ferritin-like domain-containing protein [Myxococcota bacterium]
MEAEARAELARLWAFRCQSEHEARARFAWLEPRLAKHDAPKSVVDTATRAVEDEARHRGSCETMAKRFGHQGPTHRAHGLPQWGPTELTERQRTLYTAVTMGCVIESMNVTLLGETLRVAQDEQTLRVVREIMRDEVQHARLGWAYLAAVADDADFLGPLLPRILAAAAGSELSEEAPEYLAVPSHGLLPANELRRLFYVTLQDVVLPGLSLHGIDVSAAERWRRSN